MNAVLQASLSKKKKYRMVFTTKTGNALGYTDFGFKGMSDFSLHKDEERKNRFLTRFRRLIEKNKDDPTSAMTLSTYILWNRKTIKESFKDYLKHFGLHGKIL